MKTLKNKDVLPDYAQKNGEFFQQVAGEVCRHLPEGQAEKVRHLTTAATGVFHRNCSECLDRHKAEHHEHLHRPYHHASTHVFKHQRRERFLLRMISSKLSHLCPQVIPQVLYEAVDVYLRKAFGDTVYDDLNDEANLIFQSMNHQSNHNMWEQINGNPQWKRFVDIIFIRILLRFENFQVGRRNFQRIVGDHLHNKASFVLEDRHFSLIFHTLFGDIREGLKNAEQRIRWDFIFGDGINSRLEKTLANIR